MIHLRGRTPRLAFSQFSGISSASLASVMNAPGNINIELIGIGRAILNKRLAVPMYQRSYAWEDKHVLDFLSDVQEAMDSDEPEYFLGSVVTTKNNTDRPEVADGQQRLATATVLLAAIRDDFHTQGDHERAYEITSTYLRRKDLTTLEVIPKLCLNDTDNDFFVKRILANPDEQDRAVEATKKSHTRIARAATLAGDHVKSIGRARDATARLAKLVEYVKDSVRVIWVSVSDDANAFTIFETLNDRGLTLAISDLLKNYLFGLAGNRITEVQQRWLSMVGALEAVDHEELTVTFIRHLWSSRHGLVRERDLYAVIKKSVSRKRDCVGFAASLEEGAKLYAAILNPSHDLWEEYGHSAQQHMATLNLLRMSQIRPLVLAVLSAFAAQEVRKTLRFMVSWVTRFLVTGGIGGGTLEQHYSARAKDIQEGKIRTARQLANKMKGIVPSDSKFKSAFSSATVSKAYLARYYLRALEKQAGGEEEPELVPNENEENVTLEHVLPVAPGPAWHHFSAEDKEAYVKRIGNLALLKSKINVEAGNDSFAFKKSFYRDSQYALTSELGGRKQWKPGEIDARQKRLATLAVKAWPSK